MTKPNGYWTLKNTIAEARKVIEELDELKKQFEEFKKKNDPT